MYIYIYFLYTYLSWDVFIYIYIDRYIYIYIRTFYYFYIFAKINIFFVFKNTGHPTECTGGPTVLCIIVVLSVLCDGVTLWAVATNVHRSPWLQTPRVDKKQLSSMCAGVMLPMPCAVIKLSTRPSWQRKCRRRNNQG